MPTSPKSRNQPPAQLSNTKPAKDSLASEFDNLADEILSFSEGLFDDEDDLLSIDLLTSSHKTKPPTPQKPPPSSPSLPSLPKASTTSVSLPSLPKASTTSVSLPSLPKASTTSISLPSLPKASPSSASLPKASPSSVSLPKASPSSVSLPKASPPPTFSPPPLQQEKPSRPSLAAPPPLPSSVPPPLFSEAADDPFAFPEEPLHKAAPAPNLPFFEELSSSDPRASLLEVLAQAGSDDEDESFLPKPKTAASSLNAALPIPKDTVQFQAFVPPSLPPEKTAIFAQEEEFEEGKAETQREIAKPDFAKLTQKPKPHDVLENPPDELWLPTEDPEKKPSAPRVFSVNDLEHLPSQFRKGKETKPPKPPAPPPSSAASPFAMGWKGEGMRDNEGDSTMVAPHQKDSKPSQSARPPRDEYEDDDGDSTMIAPPESSPLPPRLTQAPPLFSDSPSLDKHPVSLLADDGDSTMMARESHEESDDEEYEEDGDRTVMAAFPQPPPASTPWNPPQPPANKSNEWFGLEEDLYPPEDLASSPPPPPTLTLRSGSYPQPPQFAQPANFSNPQSTAYNDPYAQPPSYPPPASFSNPQDVSRSGSYTQPPFAQPANFSNPQSTAYNDPYAQTPSYAPPAPNPSYAPPAPSFSSRPVFTDNPGFPTQGGFATPSGAYAQATPFSVEQPSSPFHGIQAPPVPSFGGQGAMVQEAAYDDSSESSGARAMTQERNAGTMTPGSISGPYPSPPPNVPVVGRSATQDGQRPYPVATPRSSGSSVVAPVPQAPLAQWPPHPAEEDPHTLGFLQDAPQPYSQDLAPPPLEPAYPTQAAPPRSRKGLILFLLLLLVLGSVGIVIALVQPWNRYAEPVKDKERSAWLNPDPLKAPQPNPRPTTLPPPPTKREELPAKREELPAKREELPAKREELPAKREELPAKREELPAKREDTPAPRPDPRDEEEPTKRENTPSPRRIGKALTKAPKPKKRRPLEPPPPERRETPVEPPPARRLVAAIQPSPAGASGVTLSIQPACTLYEQGKKLGNSVPALHLERPPGSYKFVCQDKKNQIYYPFHVKISSGEKTTYKKTLQKGFLIVHTNPWSLVYSQLHGKLGRSGEKIPLYEGEFRLLLYKRGILIPGPGTQRQTTITIRPNVVSRTPKIDFPAEDDEE